MPVSKTRRASASRAPSAPIPSSTPLSNAELSRRLEQMAQTLAAQRENPYKIRAYRRAAEVIAGASESIDELIRAGEDVTRFPGIGAGIARALQELVTAGKFGQLELGLASLPAEVAELKEYPRLDPERVRKIYQKLGIHSVAELRRRHASGEIVEVFGQRMAAHLEQAFVTENRILLYDADPLAATVAAFLKKQAGARRVEATGALRRRVEVIDELSFLIEADDFARVVEKLQRFGGRTALVAADSRRATFTLPAGIPLRVERATAENWGVALVAATGSAAHLEQLQRSTGKLLGLPKSRRAFPTETDAYAALGLAYVPPELREGKQEVSEALAREVPALVESADLRGDLHAHTTASDGAHSLSQMAKAAQARGYRYLGITDHSQSLKIARGVTEENLWKQIRAIDRLNARLKGIRLLKSAEVDILADGSLDYSDEVLRELDYTVCSIHSRFRLPKTAQTERILRAMDHPAFGILGHATGRLLLKRPGYEIDLARIIRHARDTRCCFEINASPDRLDLSADSARLVAEAGILIAVNTDAHSIGELDYMRCGLDVARRAGLEKHQVLNCLGTAALLRFFKTKR